MWYPTKRHYLAGYHLICLQEREKQKEREREREREREKESTASRSILSNC